ncbi:MAG: metal ABC transporter substrate-binding protein [Deltaproteobacteria bacterium]
MKIYTNIRFLTLVFAFASISIFSEGRDASAEVKIVTSIPDFAAIAKEIGGDKVVVESLAKGYQDPHFVDAKPIFITRLNQADLLVYNGLDLEIGWLPILITGARNSDIAAPAALGHYNASTSIKNVLEIPTAPVDRSIGDVHPGGNPHYMLDPRNGIPVARGIAARLIRMDPENASYYEENFKNFASTLRLKISEWETELKPFKGTKVVTYHKMWIYFTKWAGLTEAGYIEPKPGIPPSPSHVANLIKSMEKLQVKLIIAANFYPEKTASLVAEKTGAAFLSLPVLVEGRDGINTYTELFDAIVGEVTSALKDKTGSVKDSVYRHKE